LLLNRVAFMGGVERVIVTSMELLAARGFEPILACPAEGELPDAVRARGFRVVSCEFDRMRSTVHPASVLRYARALRRESARVRDLCREHGVALIHAHHPVAAMYAVKAVRELGVPLVMHVHETLPLRPLYRLAMRYASPHAAHFVCVSAASRAMLESLRIPDHKVQVIYNGVHPSFLGPRPEPAADVAGPGPNVGIFGVIEPRKAQHVFLHAAARLAPRFPTARFWVVGPVAFADDEPYHASLHALADAPALRGRVTFTGYRPDVARLMMAMHAIALTSVAFDALPTVCIEALTLGRRLVASRVGGVPEIVRDGDTGTVVPPGDIDALVDALARMLLRPADDAIGERAAEDMRARFSPERYGDDLAAALAGVLAGRATTAAAVAS
jgi:glycosyltransferase involved in cell wall biosynthesis